MKTLVFVYNGDSGVVNGVMHYLHKRISPDTYPCELCGMVYDGMALKQDWLTFVKSLGMPSEFLHRDEYRKTYGSLHNAWPAVLLHNGKTLEKVVLNAQDFKDIASLEVLKERLREFVERELRTGHTA